MGKGFWKAFGRTWAKIIFSPHSFFTGISKEKSLKEPLIFAITCGVLTALVGGLIGFLGRNFIVSFAPQAIEIFTPVRLLLSYILLVITSPLVVIFLVFGGAAVLHVIVLALRGREGFRATFKVIAYSNATSLFSIIPVAGTICALLYKAVLVILGLKYAGKISTLRAVISVVLPLTVFILAVFFSLFFIFAKYK